MQRISVVESSWLVKSEIERNGFDDGPPSSSDDKYAIVVRLRLTKTARFVADHKRRGHVTRKELAQPANLRTAGAAYLRRSVRLFQP